ncbi:hypothetical protein [Plantactinospora sp. CA-290183]|uniref:hypothetical protein n=1 Tax=Plantactinospora sp. CA-290183 TaxID=3240006 RepID=UPI003D8DD543
MSKPTVTHDEKRSMFARAAIVGGLTALSCINWYGIQITGESVRAIGVDSAGNVIEPEAISRLGIGWYLTAAPFLTLTCSPSPSCDAPGPPRSGDDQRTTTRASPIRHVRSSRDQRVRGEVL